MTEADPEDSPSLSMDEIRAHIAELEAVLDARHEAMRGANGYKGEVKWDFSSILTESKRLAAEA